MCGIAGVLVSPGSPPAPFEELRRMIAMLGHRGPDGHGFYRDERIGLAHARLSIIDLAGGVQPIRNNDETIWLSFNGEIFNYIELRSHLIALGHHFRTDGDSEVIVQCYERYGARAWAMLNGQFAFALWDSRKRRLWLVRDRMGVLPLHVARVDGHVLFASEAKALFASGRLAPRFDPAGLAEAFTCWSAAAPRTVFAGVRMVRPGTALCIDDGQRESEHRFWQPGPGGSGAGCASLDEAVDGLEERLSRSVELRLRADVPVGAYISGGLDSSVIGSIAREQAQATVETFGIGFDDPRFDETPQQRQVVEHLGTRHHSILCNGAAIRDSLAEVVWQCETPLLRTSPVPLFLLSRLVRESGIKTVLSGEGADELLAGYTIFKENEIRRFWARMPDSRIRPALLGRIHHYVGTETARSSQLWQDFFGRGLQETDHPFYSHLIRWQNTAWTLRLLSPEIGSALPLDRMMAEIEDDMPKGWRDWSPLLRAQTLEIRNFMSSYLLACQGDRVAMGNGVEARYPFLDPDVVEYCLSLPKRYKLLGLRDKLALRRLAARRLPPEMGQRRKQPFRAPISRALFGPDSGGRFDDLLSEQALAEDGLINDAAAGQLLRKVRRQDGDMSGEREEMGLVGVLTLRLLQQQFGPEFSDRVRQAVQRLDRSPLQLCVDRWAGGNGGAIPGNRRLNQAARR